MNRNLRPASIGALVLLVLAAACASPPWSRGHDEDRRSETEVRLLELEKQAIKARLEIERLRERLAELEAAERAPRPAASAPSTSMPTPAPAPEPRPREAAPESAAIEEADLELPAEAGPSAPAVAGEAQREYERALALLRDGRPDAAEEALRAFVAAHPDSELADNAWFWIGESLRVRDRVEAALVAYRSGVERYPDGNKTPDALFKIGTCLDLLGDHDRAREVWRELARRFPHTVAAERASEELGER